MTEDAVLYETPWLKGYKQRCPDISTFIETNGNTIDHMTVCADDVFEFFKIPKTVKRIQFAIYASPAPDRVCITKTKSGPFHPFNVDGEAHGFYTKAEDKLISLLRGRKRIYVECHYE